MNISQVGAQSENHRRLGQETDILGQWLTEYILKSSKLHGHQVFYDHGDNRQTNVVAIKGFFGSEVKNLNRMADVDIMVVSPDQRVLLLVEVEEHGSSPKKILGDAVTIMMCNRFAVRQSGIQHYYDIANTSRLIVSGVMPNKGSRLEKVEKVIIPRFKQLTGFTNGINHLNIDFVFEPLIEKTIERLKRLFREVLPHSL